jgi:hypothetical protein
MGKGRRIVSGHQFDQVFTAAFPARNGLLLSKYQYLVYLSALVATIFIDRHVLPPLKWP